MRFSAAPVAEYTRLYDPRRGLAARASSRRGGIGDGLQRLPVCVVIGGNFRRVIEGESRTTVETGTREHRCFRILSLFFVLNLIFHIKYDTKSCISLKRYSKYGIVFKMKMEI